MDLRDMVESLRKHQQAERAKPGFYDGCTKIDWEFEEVLQEMDRNATVRIATPEESERYTKLITGRHHATPPNGREPFYRQHVRIIQDMLGHRSPQF